MITNEKSLREALKEKFGLTDDETKALEINFGCTVFNKDIASFAKEEAYYLWSGHFAKDGKDIYWACRIDGLPEVVEKDCAEVSFEDTFIARNQHFYSHIYNAEGERVLIPAWHLDLSRVLRKYASGKKYERLSGKFEYIGTKDGKKFFAWGIYDEKSQLLSAFNIEDGTWHQPEEVTMRLALAGIQVVKNITLHYEQDLVKVEPRKKVYEI